MHCHIKLIMKVINGKIELLLPLEIVTFTLNLIVESHHLIIVPSHHIWSLNEYTARPRSTFLQPLHWTRPRSKVLDTTKKNPLKRTQKKMSKGDFQRFHFMSHPWTLWLGEKNHFKGNYEHSPRYLGIEARCIKINNGKHEFKIIYQQATSGLHQSTPSKSTNIQISKRDMEER